MLERLMVKLVCTARSHNCSIVRWSFSSSCIYCRGVRWNAVGDVGEVLPKRVSDNLNRMQDPQAAGRVAAFSRLQSNGNGGMQRHPDSPSSSSHPGPLMEGGRDPDSSPESASAADPRLQALRSRVRLNKIGSAYELPEAPLPSSSQPTRNGSSPSLAAVHGEQGPISQQQQQQQHFHQGLASPHFLPPSSGSPPCRTGRRWGMSHHCNRMSQLQKTSLSAAPASTAGPALLSGWMGLAPHGMQSPAAVGLSAVSPAGRLGCAGL